MIKIRKGLDLPITGEPDQVISEQKTAERFAVVGSDYCGMKPSMSVQVGDTVKKGEVLFADKKTEGVLYTAPVAGKVVEVNRGQRRVFQSVVIQASGNESVKFKSYPEGDIDDLKVDEIKENLIQSGQWVALRRRPFDKVADPAERPKSIFVTAVDTNPLSPHPTVFINENRNIFKIGLKVLAQLAEDRVYLCKGPNTDIPTEGLSKVKTQVFAGPHPAGNAGTHIHFLEPVNSERFTWYIGYQDVIAIGHLFQSGEIFSERVVALSGPQVKKPRLIRTTLGADLNEIVAGEMKAGDNRVISGSVLSGRKAAGPFAFLGRYHNQISIIKEGREREFLGWQKPGFDKFSITKVFLSKLNPSKKFNFTSSTHGSIRAMVPIGMYEKVMPLDIQPTFLLRSLVAGDTERSQLLGCLELGEEDLSLCTFVCPGKVDYGPILRKNLEQIEKDG
jgi:Na+-transporting NADH:ubiquinone oxidoreductase subunit A